MTQQPAGGPDRHPTARIVKIGAAILCLGVLLTAAYRMLPQNPDPTEPSTLALRILAGLAISALTLTALYFLARRETPAPLRSIGLATRQRGWLQALWGMALWLVPAAATFAVFAALGSPLHLTASLADLLPAIGLLLLAVLFTEALPEEAVFRGYVTSSLGGWLRGWWIITTQAALFTLFAGILRQHWHMGDLSLFLAMGIGLGYLRMLSGSIWMPIGFHTAFQTGSQLVHTHHGLDFAGGSGMLMLALGAIPFASAAIVLSTMPTLFVRPRRVE